MAETIFTLNAPPLEFEGLDNSSWSEFLNDLTVKTALRKANIDEYLHWDDLKYKAWIPKLFPKKESFWTFLKVYRNMNSSPTPIRDAQGNFFSLSNDYYAEFLHIVDKEMAGNFMGITHFSETDKKQFIARNFIEESIASSQLEGANTSRVAAKKMLLEGRKPNNHSEKMIVNNHQTMSKIEQELYQEPLTWELLCEMHRMITDKTILVDQQGKLRETLDKNNNRLVVKPWDDQTIAYITPSKDFVEKEIQRLIDFANNKGAHEGFIHPLLKGIMLHFWIGLLHPFEDGNGRLARVLFYWYMLKNEYWAFAYMSLSEKIKKSPKQYAMSYVYSEQDGADLNYFVSYNIKKLKLARIEFQKYIQTKVDQNKLIISIHQKDLNLNERQIKLLHYFERNIEHRTNIISYQNINFIKKGTAILDLKHLFDSGFLIKKKKGRNVYYYPTSKIHGIFST